MLQSKLFTKTIKDNPKDEISANSQLLTRAGFIYKEMAGVYSYLPLGILVLRKIENIIREEMNKIGGQEILMSVFQPSRLWKETGRWDDREIGRIMYKCKEEEKEIGLGPTHEEMLTDIVRHYVKSYEDLPLYIYQVQTKFRKELRAKSGLLRGREFGMKDLYSFHVSKEDFNQYYKKAAKAYSEIFERCGLEALMTEASGAGFTKDYTHEFQVLAEGGEDTVVFCPSRHFSQNKEIAKLGAGQKCPLCKKILEEKGSIEVGNIFPLETKYSQAMAALFIDEEGQKKPIIMGCYGIGTTRLMGTIVEIHHDERGIIWPKEVAPFLVHLIKIEKSQSVKNFSEKIYKDLINSGIEVLYDDREKKTAGEKFAEADLMGAPYRIVVSERTLEKNCAEVKQRDRKDFELVKINSLQKFFKSKI